MICANLYTASGGVGWHGSPLSPEETSEAVIAFTLGQVRGGSLIESEEPA